MKDGKCLQCQGCGKVANTDDQEAWIYWEELPAGSDLAVRLGFVFPIPCPSCGGSGERTEAGV